MAALTSDPAVQAKMATAWARRSAGNPEDGIKEAEALPSGPLREAALTSLSDKWSKTNPESWLAWMRSAGTADQTAAMAGADPKIWSDPKNAAFLTLRPATEQLAWLASVYHDNAPAAAAIIEQASTQGASSQALDAAAKSLAESWQDRDPSTARAFALSLADPALANSVLITLAANSPTPESRAEAAAAIQDPAARQQAERAAALRNAGISLTPPKRK